MGGGDYFQSSGMRAKREHDIFNLYIYRAGHCFRFQNKKPRYLISCSHYDNEYLLDNFLCGLGLDIHEIQVVTTGLF